MVEDNLSTLQLELEEEQGWITYIEHECLTNGQAVNNLWLVNKIYAMI